VTELQTHLRALPDVQAVTSSSALPLAGGFQVIRWGKEDEQSDTIAGAADHQSVRPGYFEALRTPLLEGRTFTEDDNSAGKRVVIVDEFLAAREFPLESAVGKLLIVSLPGQGPQRFEVIGVVAHQRDTSLAEAGREQIYSTEGLAGHPISGYWAVRTAEDHVKCARAIRAELAKLDKNVAVAEMQPMTAFVERAEASTRFSLLLIGIFAAIAALLAGVGLYGVLATMVRQRTSEIGIRIAMGATPWSIFRLVVGRGMLVSAAGVMAGLLAALVLTRAMTSMLVGVKPADPITFAAMAALFFAIAAVASWLPARRASLLDPALALRE
jgi:predicted permease